MRTAECGGEGVQDVGELVGFVGGKVAGCFVIVADEGDVRRLAVIGLDGDEYLQRIGPRYAVQVGDRDGVRGQLNPVDLADVLVAVGVGALPVGLTGVALVLVCAEQP